MRSFNLSGPCDPDKHYVVLHEALVNKCQAFVEQARYLAIFSPSQTGKTTFCRILFHHLQEQGYLPIWVSCNGRKTFSCAQFYQALTHDLQSQSAITNQVDLQLFLQETSINGRRIVLFIDEFENMPDIVRDELLHTFRAMYHKRQLYKLQSLILVGVSTIAELVLSSASPFNVVDELRIPYFTFVDWGARQPLCPLLKKLQRAVGG